MSTTVASNKSTTSTKFATSPAPSASNSSVHSQDGTFLLPPAENPAGPNGIANGTGDVAAANGTSAARPALPQKKPTMASRLTRMFSQREANSEAAKEGRREAAAAQKGGDRAAARDADVANASDSSLRPAESARHGSVDRRSDRDGEQDERKKSVAERKKDQQTAVHQKRFTIIDPDTGEHAHNLKCAKRQEKLSDMLREMVGAKRKNGAQEAQPLSLMDNWVDQVRNEKDKLAIDQKGGPSQNLSLVQKYGKCQEVVGRGAFGIVRVAHKTDLTDPQRELLYAVKEFRRKPDESSKKYQKRLTSEFCISSSMKHPNVIKTLDLLQDEKGDFCEVMEFCAGGDLYTLILAAGQLEVLEADCFFKQLMRGVDYLHESGVAHRDLKPENLLLTQHGALKITDFGNGECFRMAWETEAHMTAGLCGSAPYIAPEEYTQQEFDARPVDVWACGVIYMAMRTGRHLWKVAKKVEDEFYERYLHDRREESGYVPIETLRRVSAAFLSSCLFSRANCRIAQLQKRDLQHTRSPSEPSPDRQRGSAVRVGEEDHRLQSW